jgi:transcription elongation factor Elf1
VIRPFFIPETFGDIGHYRAAAIGDNEARPPHYAERASCETCHGDVVALRVEKQSRHGAISCQSCHGPLAAHVASGGDPKPALPDVVPLCTRCHEVTAGRPTFIPQVNTIEHSGGETCSTCHLPHAPGVS